MKHLIKFKENNSDCYDENYMKIKFKSNVDMPLGKTLETHYVVIVVRSGLNGHNKYYPQVFFV